MPKILRRLEVVEDDAPPIVPLADVLSGAAPAGTIGIALQPADKVEDLAPVLQRASLIAVEFPGPGDGRGYTQARLLRERYKYTGEIRAVGAGVKRDLLFFMARSGVDAYSLAPGEDFESAQRHLQKYTVAYQPGAPHGSIQRQRYFS